MKRFTDYLEAAQYARDLAAANNHDVAVRRVCEYGVDGFNVSFATHADSDYALAEVICPDGTFALPEGHGV